MATVKVTDGPLSVEALLLASVPPDSDAKRGARTYNGLNLTVRRYGVVVGNYPSVSALAQSWPALAALLADKIRREQER